MKQQKTQTLIRLAVVLGILILINLISIRVFGRIDLTSQDVYTLSDASKNIVGSLDDRVTIKAYRRRRTRRVGNELFSHIGPRRHRLPHAINCACCHHRRNR